MDGLISEVSNFLWGIWAIGILMLLGLLMTVSSKGIQFRRFTLSLRLVLQGALRKHNAEKDTGDISPFQALTTAMAATIGNGNIAGVATAIAVGGPGAAFWMIVIAPLGMATKFSEAVLALRYRERNEDGTMLGGPMMYIKKGAGIPALGSVFALCACLGGIGGGNISQANSIALVMNTEFSIPFWATGLGLAILLGIVIIGGIKRIGAFAEQAVPAMVVLYGVGVLIVLVSNVEMLPAAVNLMVTSAFEPAAPVGGFAGATVARTIEYGVRRGVISSEAGIGSAGIAHGAASTTEPLKQGYLAMIGVFIDTIVVCSMTAMTVVVTGVWDTGLISTAMVASAFNLNIPYGGIIIAFCSLRFGFTTMVTWAYYGEQGLRFLWKSRHVVTGFRVIWCMCAVFGAVYGARIIWDISDILIWSMMAPNVVGLLYLVKEIRVITDQGARVESI
ncbi:MAG: amino acid carrier protein [Gemmatimonadota bacterium]|nr:amino acid carrier protein [Gemmatimonadota bacterium]